MSNFVNNGTDEATLDYLRKSVGYNDYKPDKREITLRGTPRLLDQIELMLAYMQNLGDRGHSASFTVSVDGDGAFSVSMKRGSKELSKLYSDKLKEKSNVDDDIESFSFD